MKLGLVFFALPESELLLCPLFSDIRAENGHGRTANGTALNTSMLFRGNGIFGAF
jgi:hypothetical protein